MNLDQKEALQEQSLVTIPELSNELGVPDNTLRKYVNYFGLETVRSSRKVYLTPISVANTESIVRLRKNGLPLSEIKNLLDKRKFEDPLARQKEEEEKEKEEEEKRGKEEEREEKKEKRKEVRPAAVTGSNRSFLGARTLEEIETEPVTERGEKKEEKEEGCTPGSLIERNQRVENQVLEKDSSLNRNTLNRLVANVSRKIAQMKKSFFLLPAEGRERAEREACLRNQQMFLDGVRNLRDNWCVE